MYVEPLECWKQGYFAKKSVGRTPSIGRSCSTVREVIGKLAFLLKIIWENLAGTMKTGGVADEMMRGRFFLLLSCIIQKTSLLWGSGSTEIAVRRVYGGFPGLGKLFTGKPAPHHIHRGTNKQGIK